MPAVPKTSEVDIVAAARALIARQGVAKLSMQEVAESVGVRASALYKRFADRQTLIETVAHLVLVDMHRLQRRVAVTGSPHADLRAIAHAHRKFALRNQHLYDLVFGSSLGRSPFAAAESAASVEILLDRIGRIAKPSEALDAARTLVAFTHGFVSMELAEAFRLGGNVERAFEFGLTRLIASLSRRRAR